jgi:hypothetical protein
LKKCIDRKIHTFVEDEAGLSRPLFVSLVIPTKIDVGGETRQFEINALRKVLLECNRLVDLGYLDEIIVIDGSRDKDGNPDYSILQNVVRLAYDSLNLFRVQVELINEYIAESVKAKRGFFDFIVKGVHQFDRNLFKVLATYGFPKISGFNEMPSGKGVALWLSIPIAKGDIVCFVDSDIMNFMKKYIVALCDPLIETWDGHPSINYVKASYRRLTYSFENERLRLGGRVTRLFMKPLLRVLGKEYPGMFGGLKNLVYPLSGEQSMCRDLIERIRFPCNYAIEMSILNQLRRLEEVSSTRQVDLDWLYHIGQPTVELMDMVTQITECILNIFEDEGVHLTKKDVEDLVSKYDKEATKMISQYRKTFMRAKERVSHFFDQDLNYDEDVDKANLDLFLKTFQDTLKSYDKTKPTTILPPWIEIKEKLNYHAISHFLGVRSNQSTQRRLWEIDLISH